MIVQYIALQSWPARTKQEGGQHVRARRAKPRPPAVWPSSVLCRAVPCHVPCHVSCGMATQASSEFNTHCLKLRGTGLVEAHGIERAL